MTPAQCRSCKEPVVWVETEATDTKPGRRMPLDADPDDRTRALVVDDGNLVFTSNTTGAGVPIVRYVPKGAGRHRSHFASCKQAGSWRKR